MAVAENEIAELLREKALLLLLRERELYTMRQGKSRAAAWLEVAFGLSQGTEPSATLERLCARWTEAVIHSLHFQVAGWLALAPEAHALRPIVWQTPSGKAGAARSLPPEAAAFLATHEAGFCNEPAPACDAAAVALGRVLGLEKFHWLLTSPAVGDKILMVAGFTVATGSYRSLEEEDVKYFRLLGEHLVVMMQNARLFADLQQERGALLDLTRNLEVRIAERTQELEQANQSLTESLRKQREMQEQLVQAGKMAGIGQLAAGVAHEINNPLGVILGFAQGMERRAQAEELRLPVTSIVREALRCKGLVQELLTFSRTAKPQVEEVEINRLVGKAMLLLEAKAKTQNVQIILELAEGLPVLMANATQIEQVLVNLGANALDAMTCGGCLTLRTSSDDKAIVVELTDTGAGIPKEIRARIFDPFFTTKEVGKGTGLGLSLVYDIVHRLGGVIDVQSEVGKGTTMRIELPIVGSQTALAGGK